MPLLTRNQSMSKLTKKLRGKMPKPKKIKIPLWKGPSVDGITQSLLGRFLECRERFRLLVVHGISGEDKFDPSMHYGEFWHLCEECSTAKERDTRFVMLAKEFCKKYPSQQHEVNHWYNVCKVQHEVYSKVKKGFNKPKEKVKPLLREYSFSIPYVIPDGREVILRGKWDGVDLVGSGKTVFLQEHKTKGRILEDRVSNQLNFDLQTGLYLSALRCYTELESNLIGGVIYNVIRRPLSGGKHSIRQKQKQTKEEFYQELKERIEEDSEYFFMQWRSHITDADIAKFRRQFLDPILTQLCDWWEYISCFNFDPFSVPNRWDKYPSEPNSIHWRHPYGVYNHMNEAVPDSLDEYLANGSMSGLSVTDNLFPEL